MNTNTATSKSAAQWFPQHRKLCVVLELADLDGVMASLAQTTQDTADSRALHMEQVAALLHQHGIPAEYDEKYAADEDLYRIAMFKVTQPKEHSVLEAAK